MKKPLTAAILLLLLTLAAAPVCRAQSDEELARGQKYLAKVAGLWSGKLPVDRLLGMYLGRKWIGSVRATVKAAPEDSGAAYEVTWVGEARIGERAMKAETHYLLAGNLGPVSAEATEDDGKQKTKKTLTTDGKRWKFHQEKDGEVTDREGDLRLGTTWGVGILELFAEPDDDTVTLISPGEKSGVCVFKKVPEKRKRRVGRTEAECRVVEVTKGDDKPELAYYTEDGALLETVAAANSWRMRPIEESEAGRNLDEPADFTPAEQALIEVFKAIKRGDKGAVLEAFDAAHFVAATLPGYAALSEERKGAAIEEFRRGLEKSLLRKELQDQLPDEKSMEDVFAGSMKTVEKDGVASVEFFGSVWKLSQATEGDRKGRWLIVELVPRK